MSEIDLAGLHKTYRPGLFKKPVRAVCDLSLQVEKGEVFGLIGPNGAGKSTTIRMMLGMSRPDQGTIHFRGQSLAKTEFRNETGYLPENPYLYDHLSLEELLVFCGRTSGLTSAKIRSRSHALIEKLNLLEAARRPLRAFSKGMLQRAGICFALLHDPSIIIFDEPMSGLDPIGRRMVFDLILELREQGKTIFFCSHILSDVERLCDRIGIMVGGHLARVLEKRDFLEAPERSIHLLLPSLSEDQQNGMEGLNGLLTQEEGGTVFSAIPADLPQIMEVLQQRGIEIRATRSERLSLEELFMSIVKEHQA